ncbi:hypothetical protein QFZ99_004661 [Paraburkholderia atlantica]|uniref:hypothetical protein n=1 Tax=Paraburkholderia atlantica TaxID=2654982 RepID=UPI003D24DDD5
MYLVDGDAVAVHTLSCAAREIYEKHCAHLELDRGFDYIKASNPEYKEKDLWNVLNGARNFFKHPGKSLEEEIELRDTDNKHMLFLACHDCAMLCPGQHPPEVQAFKNVVYRDGVSSQYGGRASRRSGGSDKRS